MTFGQRLRSAREAKKLTQAQLGRGLGTDDGDASKSVVLGWEKDRHFPRADQLAVICARLSVGADWLLLGKQEEALSAQALSIARQFDAMGEEDQAHILLMWDAMLRLATKSTDEIAERKFRVTR